MAPPPPPKWGCLHCSRRSSRAPPVVSTTNDGVLPLDLLYDILLRLPTETICRFRAVCRSWQSVLCHPDFIAAARNPGPLIAISTCYARNEVNVLDLESGDAIERVNVATNDGDLQFMGAIGHDCLVSVVRLDDQLCLLDLTSGVVFILPEVIPSLQGFTDTFYNASSTRSEHKLLAVTNHSIKGDEQQVCNILTLGDEDGGWRDTGHPPINVKQQPECCVVIDGIAYFLPDCYPAESMEIMAFDFESEAWRASLEGPAGEHPCICLADMDGHLVAARPDSFENIELWFLVDSYWSKRYTVTITSSHQNHYWRPWYDYFIKPLEVLEDGRIVLWMWVAGVDIGRANNMMRIYDPRTKTFMDGTHVSLCISVDAFRWNLLRSGPTSGAIDMAAKRLLINRRCHHQSRASPSMEGVPNKEL